MPIGKPLMQIRANGEDLKLQEGRLEMMLHIQSMFDVDRLWVQARDKKWDYFDAVFEDDAEIQFKLGVELEEERWQDEHTLSVVGANPAYHPDMMRMILNCHSLSESLSHRCSQKIFTDKKISEIVTDLADGAGLDTQVEETKGKFSISQGCLTDWNFINGVLLPLAFNESRYDYVCYTKKGKTLVFEPPDVSSQKAEIIFPGENEDFGSVDMVQCYFMSNHMFSGLSYSTQVRGFDPLKKEASFYTADDEVQYEALASKKPTAPDNPVVIVPLQVPGRDKYKEPSAEDVAKALWSTDLRQLWVAMIHGAFSPSIEAGDTVSLNLKGQDGKTHFTSGKYLVAAVIHWFDLSIPEYRTRLWLVRRTTEQ